MAEVAIIGVWRWECPLCGKPLNHPESATVVDAAIARHVQEGHDGLLWPWGSAVRVNFPFSVYDGV